DNTLIFNGCVSGGVEGESRLNVSGGTLNLVRAYANQNDSRLYVNQTGGFMNASNTFTVGHGGTQKTNVQAQYAISGGHATFSGLLVGNAGATLTSANCGSGRFEVNGLWTVQGITKTIEVVNSLQLYHTLAFNFGATGVTPIDADTFVLGTTDGANPTIELGVLDGLTAGDVAAGTYDLVRLTSAWTGSLDDIVLVVPAGSGWTVQVSNDGKALQVVIPVSNIPEADAGEDQTVHDDDGDDEETVTLDGSGSHDEGGTIVSYAWSIASTQIATGVAPQVVLPTGTHVITLVVTNDQSGTDDDTVTIVVNKPPVANAGQDQSVEDADDDGLASVTLNGAASSDSDGTVVEYHWFDYDGEPIGSGSSVNASLPVGLHDIGLCVVDNSGGTGWTVVRYWVTPKIDFYVDTNNPGASDTNPGTAALPFKTIGKSVTAVASGSGQAIMVKGGVYREGLNINRPGQDDAGRITLMGAPFEKVVLTGADVLTGWTQCTQQTARNNPNWASIYCKDIDWQPSMLIQDDVALTIASSPENELWSPTATGTTTTFQDTVHLTQQAAGYWLGANLVYRGGVGMSYSRTVTGFDPATGTITFTPAKSTSCVTSDLYFFQHKVEFISGAGQWAVEKVDETTYRVFCWPAGGGTPDSYVVEADHRTYGIKFNTANNHWTFDNLEVRHVQGAGIGYSPTGAGYVVRNCVVRDNAQTGLAFT
ncbi:MAG TPA: hypothetical protein PLP01_16905, partial [Phycisphaerae bacterium]|nr:hypothetical protein [Phycisphaerae bacterium]